jgi:peroxiredoxin
LEAQFPEFEAKDISGRTWRLEDLRGKFTVIYFWHTFEARKADTLDPQARQRVQALPDLPEVQRFYDKVRTAKNLQVLTFCSDYDYTHAPAYMKEKQYTFPVIADWVLIEKLFRERAGPGTVLGRQPGRTTVVPISLLESRPSAF